MLDLMEDNSILLAFSRQKEESITNERYNVNRNYFYLSGVLEFDNVVLLTKINSKTQEIIYINPYDELKAKWVGAPFSKEKVTELSSIQDVRYKEGLKSDVKSYLTKAKTIYLDFEPNDSDILTPTEDLSNKIRTKMPWINIKNARDLFKECRMVKHEEEIEEIKKAIHITNLGIQNILNNMKESPETDGPRQTVGSRYIVHPGANRGPSESQRSRSESRADRESVRVFPILGIAGCD